MLRHLTLLLLALTCFAFYGHAQDYSTNSKKAIKNYEKGMELIRSRNMDAIREGSEYLKAALEVDPNFVEAHLALASTYKLVGLDDKAQIHYKQAAEIAPDDKKLGSAYYILADLYMAEGDYLNAKMYYEKAAKYPPRNRLAVERIQDQLKVCEYAVEGIKNPIDFNPRLMEKSVNMYASQAYPMVTADREQLFFTQKKGAGNQFDENIVVSYFRDGHWSRPESVSNNINTPLNEGACTISADGKTLVFVSCNRKDSQGSCDMYISKKKGGEWSIPVNMGDTVNSAAWDSEPSLTADGRGLYFTSTRPGLGNDDIWYTELDENDRWTLPKNLGKNINTSKKDVSPFINANGKVLYFASNGRPGYGRMDIYYVIKSDTGWSAPKNLGYPVNTHLDEATLFITPDYNHGYYSKYTKMGINEIYSRLYEFDVPQELKSEFSSNYVKGTVSDASTKQPLEATVELVDLNKKKTVQLVTSDPKDGEYLLVLTKGSNYALLVKKDGYLPHSMNFDYSNIQSFDPVALNIELIPVSGDGETVMNNVFFESGSYALDEKSEVELNVFLNVLKSNPKVKFQISGHTDNVGSDADNLTLSRNRAKAVYDWFVTKGILKTRLSYKGYGASKPVATNDTDKGKALNRRIEVKLIK